MDVASLTALQYKRQTEYPAFRKAYNKYRYPGSGYTYFGFNLKDPRFADRRVRQAFAHAINKQELHRRRRAGARAARPPAPSGPGTWANNPDVKRVPLRSQEGDGAAGRGGLDDAQRRRAAGQGRQAVHLRAADQPGQRRAQEDRRDHPGLARASIGIGVEIRIIEWAALLKEYIKKRSFEAIVLGLGDGRRSRPVRGLALLADAAPTS